MRRVQSADGLVRWLDDVASGREVRPDWLELRGGARLDALPAPRRREVLAGLHGSVLRGFKHPALPGGRKRQLSLWREIAAAGFNDFGSTGYAKCYDSPFVESYDYVGPYLEGGLEALDPYAVYSAVLGTHDYGVEDFAETSLMSGVRTVIEPMAGSAELAYGGHFRFPDFHYVMFDLDPHARDLVLARPWLPETERHYIVADVLEENVWQQAKSLTSGASLCYVGKQSHQFFGARDLLRLMELATQYTDYLLLEIPSPTPMDELPETDEMTRPEMEAAGFRVALVDEPDGRPNPITHRMSFRLDAWDRRGRRTLFRYPGWTSWPLPMLVGYAELLGVNVAYFHSEEDDFLPVDRGTETSDLHENVIFMAFTRHELTG